MMSQDTRRLQKVSGDVRDEHLMFCPKEPRLTFPEKENTKGLKKIPKLEDLAKYSIIGRKPRRADLDMNHHVNNVTYIGWLLEVTGDIASPESGVIQKFPVMKGATVEQENK
ncbi:LOW QUALITY PROTEIN: oleoyl-acyl carrier protein thioesterase 1, chloroplastic [Raphanus sativus]|uniref:LOW QUALITY PROTEIN: oleoyl-acyl carrier protein thioesterase 1, chloroplastic n=1 Tax=Raphanus sativus TaxID=3726 RepID=A0A9W3DBH3_RAPSA|nr:LOW QUALITY PROTEIN: oleoyl-acyl carrier protein thioesterase 1, chloroplastic [Raphanus sativus]